MSKSLQQREAPSGCASGLFLFELPFQGLLLLARKPVRIARPIRKQEVHKDAEQHRRDAPININPLPPLQPKQTWIMNRNSIYETVRSYFKQSIRDLRAGDL